MRIIGIYEGHNCSACVVDDGRVVAAAEEERFSRIKMHDGRLHGMPEHSLRYVLQESGATAEEDSAGSMGLSGDSRGARGGAGRGYHYADTSPLCDKCNEPHDTEEHRIMYCPAYTGHRLKLMKDVVATGASFTYRTLLTMEGVPNQHQHELVTSLLEFLVETKLNEHFVRRLGRPDGTEDS